MEYTTHCMWCGCEVPCAKPECEKERGTLAAATAALDASFKATPLPVGLIPDARGMNQKQYMREANEILYDIGAL